MSEHDEDDDPSVVKARRRRTEDRLQDKRDRHADAQNKYRAKLRDRRAPSRSDLATFALGVVLQLYKRHSNNKQMIFIRRKIIVEMVKAGFAEIQVKRRFDNMLEHCETDLDKWRHIRGWHEERRERERDSRSEKKADD